ncbi:MAG TPA: DUF4013 domain-containing protein [Anaerolineales bacterium]|nr:DUF4013 domain-containing protein [Anaerolineales bacterium]
MKIGKAISFIFDDPDWWKKLLIGSVIILIPIIGWFVLLGWRLEIIKRVAQEHHEPLPSFDDFGDYLTRGFNSFLVQIVFKSPIILFFIVAFFLFLVPFFPNGNVTDETLGILVLFLIGGAIIALPIDFILALFERSAQIELAVKGKLSSSFALTEVYALVKSSWVQLVLALIAIFLAGMIIHSLGSVLLIVGTLLAQVILSAFSGHLYGQIYNNFKPLVTTAPTADPNVITM